MRLNVPRPTDAIHIVAKKLKHYFTGNRRRCVAHKSVHQVNTVQRSVLAGSEWGRGGGGGGEWTNEWMKGKLNNGVVPFPVININFLFEWGKFCQFNCVDATRRHARIVACSTFLLYYYHYYSIHTDTPHNFPTSAHKTWCMHLYTYTWGMRLCHHQQPKSPTIPLHHTHAHTHTLRSYGKTFSRRYFLLER